MKKRIFVGYSEGNKGYKIYNEVPLHDQNTRPLINKRKSNSYGKATTLTEVVEPHTAGKALKGPDAGKWKTGMDKELSSLKWVFRLTKSIRRRLRQTQSPSCRTRILTRIQCRL